MLALHPSARHHGMPQQGFFTRLLADHGAPAAHHCFPNSS
jgi:hypothetical protein